MSAKISKSTLGLLSVCLILLQLSPASEAQVFKWVDANGQTHYSDKKDQTGKAQVEALKLNSSPSPAPAGAEPIPAWQLREAEFKRRQAKTQARAWPTMSAKSRSSYRSDEPETDTSRCVLARDILSGVATHSGGARTDGNDREIAQRDIAAFCR
jgi:hypothetical protein